MHGRLKVRTSEEQAEAKRRDKEKKVKWYKQTTTKIFNKRALGEKDDELLKLTGEVLLENSDLSTMWIIRREIIEIRLPTLSDDVTEFCQNELALLERCLRSNPKAYCIWVHRQWIMDHTPNPNWDQEKRLCDLFLSYDERNFHCWDYRRYVVKKAQISVDEEFAFSTEKIATNFSNYSAWHYRSKLLPLVHPSTNEEGNIDSDAMQKEYELVQNAFYTDPSDQSAWFYHKWLLGRGKKSLAIGCGLIQREHTTYVHVAFNQPVLPTARHPIVVLVNNTPVIQITQSDWPKSLWSFDLLISDRENVSIKVKLEEISFELTLKEGEKELWFINDVESIFQVMLTSASPEILTSELVICRELLQLEPDNKWCLLSTLQLLEAIDPMLHHVEILNLFDKLVSTDPYRKGYYLDLRSRHAIGFILREHLMNFDPTCPLDLSDKGLTHLDYTEYMIMHKHINLRGNQIRSESLQGLVNFKSVQTLILDNNSLKEIPPSLNELTTLSSLSLDNNDIRKMESFSLLKDMRSLKKISIRGNPVCEIHNFVDVMKTYFINIENVEF